MKISDINLPRRVNAKFKEISEFIVESEIGSGGFSHVFKVLHKSSNKYYALKRIDLSVLSIVNKENIEKEIEAHMKMDSPYIIKLLDFFAENNIILNLVLDYCARGNLFQHLVKNNPLADSEIRRIFRQTCLAIQHIHANGYILRDLKPENVLLDDHGSVKLCDFGWCASLKDLEFRKAKAGTFAYMSPESLRGELQDERTDIWSLGIFLYELYQNKEPFAANNYRDQLRTILLGPPAFSPQKSTPTIAKKLILEILQIEAGNRPSLISILNSAFLRESDNQCMTRLTSNIMTDQSRRVVYSVDVKRPAFLSPKDFFENLKEKKTPVNSIYNQFVEASSDKKTTNLQQETTFMKPNSQIANSSTQIDSNNLASEENSFISGTKQIRYSTANDIFQPKKIKRDEKTSVPPTPKTISINVSKPSGQTYLLSQNILHTLTDKNSNVSSFTQTQKPKTSNLNSRKQLDTENQTSILSSKLVTKNLDCIQQNKQTLEASICENNDLKRAVFVNYKFNNAIKFESHTNITDKNLHNVQHQNSAKNSEELPKSKTSILNKSPEPFSPCISSPQLSSKCETLIEEYSKYNKPIKNFEPFELPKPELLQCPSPLINKFVEKKISQALEQSPNAHLINKLGTSKQQASPVSSNWINSPTKTRISPSYFSPQPSINPSLLSQTINPSSHNGSASPPPSSFSKPSTIFQTAAPSIGALQTPVIKRIPYVNDSKLEFPQQSIVKNTKLYPSPQQIFSSQNSPNRKTFGSVNISKPFQQKEQPRPTHDQLIHNAAAMPQFFKEILPFSNRMMANHRSPELNHNRSPIFNQHFQSPTQAIRSPFTTHNLDLKQARLTHMPKLNNENSNLTNFFNFHKGQNYVSNSQQISTINNFFKERPTTFGEELKNKRKDEQSKLVQELQLQLDNSVIHSNQGFFC